LKTISTKDFETLSRIVAGKTPEQTRSFFFRQLRNLKPLLNSDELINERQQVTAVIMWWEYVCKKFSDESNDDEKRKAFVNAFRAAQHEFAALALSRYTPEELRKNKEGSCSPTHELAEEVCKRRKIDENSNFIVPETDDFDTLMESRYKTQRADPIAVKRSEEVIKQLSNSIGTGHVYLPMQPVTFIPQPVANSMYLPPLPKLNVPTDENKWVISVQVQPTDMNFRISVNPNRSFTAVTEAVASRMTKKGTPVSPADLLIYVRTLDKPAELDPDDIIGDILRFDERDNIIIRKKELSTVVVE